MREHAGDLNWNHCDQLADCIRTIADLKTSTYDYCHTAIIYRYNSNVIELVAVYSDDVQNVDAHSNDKWIILNMLLLCAR